MTGQTLYAKTIGESNPDAILFLPGFTGSHEVWGRQFQALSDTYKLILVDTLGFGNSPKPDIAYTIDDHLDALRSTLQSLHVSRAHILGHSMGSLLALAYAHRFPESIIKLVLIALPWYRDEQEAREIIKNSSLFNKWLAMDTPLAHMACTVMCFLRPLLKHVVPMFVQDVPAVVVKEALRHTWTSYSRTLQNVIIKGRPQEWIREIRQPVLMIQGTLDRIAQIESLRDQVTRLPYVRLIELKAGHSPIFTHSGAIRAEIERFLRNDSTND